MNPSVVTLRATTSFTIAESSARTSDVIIDAWYAHVTIEPPTSSISSLQAFHPRRSETSCANLPYPEFVPVLSVVSSNEPLPQIRFARARSVTICRTALRIDNDGVPSISSTLSRYPIWQVTRAPNFRAR